MATLSLKSVRAAHPLRHLRFLACACAIVCVFHLHILRMRCTTVRDHAHTGEVLLFVRLILRKIRNILSIRRTLDISSKNRCCNCDLYSGKYGIQNSCNVLCHSRSDHACNFILIIIIPYPRERAPTTECSPTPPPPPPSLFLAQFPAKELGRDVVIRLNSILCWPRTYIQV